MKINRHGLGVGKPPTRGWLIHNGRREDFGPDPIQPGHWKLATRKGHKNHHKKPRKFIWVFPKIGVPQNRWFIMENPTKMDDLEGTPTIFGNIHFWEPEFQVPALWKGFHHLRNLHLGGSMFIFGGCRWWPSRRDQTAYLRSLEVTNHNPWDVWGERGKPSSQKGHFRIAQNCQAWIFFLGRFWDFRPFGGNAN